MNRATTSTEDETSAAEHDTRGWGSFAIVMTGLGVVLGLGLLSVIAGPYLLPMIPLLTVLPLGCLLAAMVHTRRHPSVRHATTTLRFVCAQCGYGIADPAVPRCTECGHQRFWDRARPSRAQAGWSRVGDAMALLITIGLVAGSVYLTIQSPLGIGWAAIVTIVFGGPIVLVLLLPSVLLQLAMIGRVRHGLVLVGLVALAGSILATSWPQRVLWAAHRSGFERLHARVVADESVDLPQDVGLLRVESIERDPGGAIGYWLGGGDRRGYIRLPEGVNRPPSFNQWSQMRLDDRWWFHVSD